jgi:hypothetical protein
MNHQASNQIREHVDTIYRTEFRRVFATLIRLLGDFDLAEEAVHEAFSAAVSQWSRDGIPANPRSWLVSAGRFKAIDTIRRRARFDSSLPELASQIDQSDTTVQDQEDIVKANADSEAGMMPSEQILTGMGKYNEELVKAGILLAAEGLHPSSKGVRVMFSGANRIVTDGPFAETKELIAGFWLWQVNSMAEAIEWIKRCPMQESELKIRPIFAAEDFGAAFTPELKQQEERIRAEAEKLQNS